MNRWLIKQGRVLCPAQKLDRVCDVAIENDVIVAVGDAPENFHGAEVINAESQWVFPGLIDMACHLGGLSFKQQASLTKETEQAVAGGITSLCCWPDTHPVIDMSAVVEQITLRTREANNAKVYCYGALTKKLEGKQLAPMAALQQVGCVAVSNGRKAIVDTALLRQALDYADSYQLPVVLQAEDPWLGAGGILHEGQVSMRLGLPGIPAASESMAIARCIELITQTRQPLHFSKVSCEQSLEIIQQAKQKGLPVTADVAIHHLFLTEMDLLNFNTAAHVHPPLRTMRDLTALQAAVSDGLIDVICSDHCSVSPDDKLKPLGQALPGIAGLATLLPLLLRLHHHKGVALFDLLAKVTSNPAKILGLPQGCIKPGSVADVVVVNPEKTMTVDPERFLSVGRNTPFDGWLLQGGVTNTFVNGELKYTEN